jgi:hypothetical protein
MTKAPPRIARDPNAYMFDQVLKKLETTKQRKHKSPPQNNSIDNSDGSSFDSRNDDHFDDFDDNDGGRDEQRHGNERRLFETRQLFVDRGSGIVQTSVDSFIEKQKSAEWHRDLVGPVDNNEELPSAILKVSPAVKRLRLSNSFACAHF